MTPRPSIQRSSGKIRLTESAPSARLPPRRSSVSCARSCGASVTSKRPRAVTSWTTSPAREKKSGLMPRSTRSLLIDSSRSPRRSPARSAAPPDATSVAFALFFHNYSTFLARPGVYLEDLFVKPEARGRGYGRALLARLAAIARERDCGRVEWAVLDWNEPSIAFYRSLGAVSLDDWKMFRLTGEALDELALIHSFPARS